MQTVSVLTVVPKQSRKGPAPRNAQERRMNLRRDEHIFRKDHEHHDYEWFLRSK
jgi:hypothetical protein